MVRSVEVYVCEEREPQTPVPRHFLPPVAVCREVPDLVSRVLEILRSSEVEALERGDEVVIADERCRELGVDEGYIRIRPATPRSRG